MRPSRATGFATSVIGCGCEAGIERELAPHETPDGRPGVAVLLFAMSGKELAKQIERRVGQCVLTCPTTAVFAGIAEGEAVALGKNLRFFGDGWQITKVIGGVRYWRVPVMDGEFVAQETTAVVKGVGGGNLLLLARDTDAALAAAEAAVAAMRALPNVIMPFPGGVVRSGSKVGSKYPALSASTNDAFCPSAAWPGRPQRADAADPLRAGDRDRRPERSRRRRGDARRHATPASRSARRPGCCASRPATTAASSGRSTSTCTSCSASERHERLDACAPSRRPRCGSTCAA